MPASNKNIVELSDDQLQAFHLLFPHLPVATKQQKQKKQERRKQSDWRPRNEAIFKRKYPFS